VKHEGKAGAQFNNIKEFIKGTKAEQLQLFQFQVSSTITLM